MTDTPSPADKDAIREAKRLCFFSHFDADGMIDDYVLHYLRELRDAGFIVVFVTTANLTPGEVRRIDGLCAAVMERENFGLDFGGWIEGLACFPDMQADLLLLCNDSVYGPFWSLSEFIAELTSVPADFYGAVRSLEPVSFLHSWFLLLRPSAYRSAPFRSLMRQPITPEMTKLEIIAKFEEALTPLLVKAGLRYHVGFDPEKMGPVLAKTPVNAAFTLWRELLAERLVPFVKIGLLRDRPPTVRGLKRWRDTLAGFDPALADIVSRNLMRRLQRHTPFRGGLPRALLDWPTFPLAHLPVSHGVLAREVKNRSQPYRRNRRFEGFEATYDVVRAPYVWAYRVIDRFRKRRRRPT